MIDVRDLPGRELIERGLADVQSGRKTVEALLVAVAAPRLEALGLEARGPGTPVAEPELALYALLGASGVSDPYSRYNALLRELSSFIRALEHRISRERRGVPESTLG